MSAAETMLENNNAIMGRILIGIEIAMQSLSLLTLENIAFPMKTREIFSREIMNQAIVIYTIEQRLAIKINNSAGKDHPAFTPFCFVFYFKYTLILHRLQWQKVMQIWEDVHNLRLLCVGFLSDGKLSQGAVGDGFPVPREAKRLPYKRRYHHLLPSYSLHSSSKPTSAKGSGFSSFCAGRSNA
ncbi:MAG: hypothetical protein IKU27_08275, partial [Clostridia bacterium]|nr:hypothetical protein [Clostridia bacterium]